MYIIILFTKLYASMRKKTILGHLTRNFLIRTRDYFIWTGHTISVWSGIPPDIFFVLKISVTAVNQ